MPVMDKMFTQATIEKGSFNDEEQSFVAWASRPVVDRDHEVIASNAWDLENFEKNPVLLWAHDYSKPPIGTVMWTKQQRNGLKFKPVFHQTAMGKEIFQLYKDGVMNAFSVGFIPNDWEDDEGKSKEGEMFNKPLRTYTEVELLEISCVPVPSCPDALVERYLNGEIKTKGLQAAVEYVLPKSVIPYKKYELAPEDASWDGSKERAAADVDALRRMSTWFDSENPGTKSSYKLPHHRASGHNTVWRGVAAAMVALLGGRGGVDIPADDKRGVHNHLARHYREFDKPVPELKEYEPEEVEVIELSYEMETVNTSAGKVGGIWEAVDVEPADPIERMRQSGLEKAVDGIVPLTTELFNQLLDGYQEFEKSKQLDNPDEQPESDAEIVASDAKSYTDEDIGLMVKLAIENKRYNAALEKARHSIAELKGQVRVMNGGVG